MASPFTEIDALPAGLEAMEASKGPFVQNCFRNESAWEVRKGFGQLGQFDPSFTNPNLDSGPGAEWGYIRHMGSTLMETDFGHLQVISVLVVKGLSSATAEEFGRGRSGLFYGVSIYDVTTGRRWDEILHPHTSERGASVIEMPAWRATGEDNRNSGTEAWLDASGDTGGVFFVEHQDNLLFGNEIMGLWAYIPSAYDLNRLKHVEPQRIDDCAAPWGESSKVVRIHPKDGLFPDGYRYLDTAAFPVPVDCAVINNRVCMAQGRTIYFSDIGRPNSIIGTNILDVGCEDRITAIAEVNGSLIIWTPRETWLYRLNAGTTVSSGDLRKLSATIGCSGPASKTRVDGSLVWLDGRGIYTTSGQYDITTISDAIRELFDAGLSLPLSNYYQGAGFSDLVEAQPRSFIRWNPDHSFHIGYDPLQSMLLISMPNENCALCLQQGKWSLWHFESVCNVVITDVGRQENLPEPWLLPFDGRIFMVSGVEEYSPSDSITPAENNPTFSYIVAEWGRGGNIDRSVESTDDNRLFAGYWNQHTNIVVPFGSPQSMFFGPPVEMPDNFQTPQGGSPASGVFMVPVWVMPDQGGPYDRITAIFTFDNTLWQPVLAGATEELDVVFPAERDSSRFGWGNQNINVDGSREIQVYSAGAPAVGGNEIRMRFNATGLIAGIWTHQPNMNLAEEQINPIMWLPFTRLLTTQTNSMGLAFSTASLRSNEITTGMAPWVWHFAALPTRHNADDVAQPIDWFLKSAQLGLNQPNQIRLRTLYMRMKTHAQSPSIFATWPRGLLNVVFASDFRDWSSQIVDQLEGALEADNKAPYRSRLRNNSGAMVRNTFGAAAAPPLSTDARWGNSGDDADGNVLVGDESYDTQQISDSIRGEHVSVGMFGHQRGHAERVVMDQAKVAVQKRGNRRRIGR